MKVNRNRPLLNDQKPGKGCTPSPGGVGATIAGGLAAYGLFGESLE
jgi:hypothetical protein